MIESKNELNYFLQEDLKQFLLEGSIPGMKDFILQNERWYIYHLKRQLRYVEYYSTRKDILGVVLYFVHFFIYKRLCWKTKCIINPNTIGPGLTLWHLGSFTYVRKGSVIGNNFTMVGGVVLGQKKGDGKERIVIGDNCYCGINVTIIGNVTVGDNVKIGAHALVDKDIPSNCIAVGVPAKAKKI